MVLLRRLIRFLSRCQVILILMVMESLRRRFPYDPTETTDLDGDGIGDNADLDDDGDRYNDDVDAFPEIHQNG